MLSLKPPKLHLKSPPKSLAVSRIARRITLLLSNSPFLRTPLKFLERSSFNPSLLPLTTRPPIDPRMHIPATYLGKYYCCRILPECLHELLACASHSAARHATHAPSLHS